LSKKHEILVDFRSKNPSIETDKIKIVKGNISLLDNSNVFKITFLPVKGGKSSILGFKLKESNGDDFSSRLKVECGFNKYGFSVNEILEWQITNIGNEIIYMGPEICVKNN
jgi:hypothetical protein